MAEVVKLMSRLQDRMSLDWRDELVECLEEVDHPGITPAIVESIANGMDYINDTGLSLGCLPLGIEFYADEEGKSILFFHDRYEMIDFTNVGQSRMATLEELGRPPMEMELFYFMNILARPLKTTEKLLLGGREVLDSLTFGQRLMAHRQEVLGGDVEQSALCYMTVAIPIRLIQEHGYRLHSMEPVEEEGSRFMRAVMTGEGMELTVEINLRLLHNRYELFMERLHRWQNEN